MEARGRQRRNTYIDIQHVQNHETRAGGGDITNAKKAVVFEYTYSAEECRVKLLEGHEKFVFFFQKLFWEIKQTSRAFQSFENLTDGEHDEPRFSPHRPFAPLRKDGRS